MTETDIVHIYQAGLDAVQAGLAMQNHVQRNGEVLHVNGRVYHLDNFRRILVIGAGKATAQMAFVLESLIGDRISAGHIVVKYGHAASLKVIRQTEASHPLPDEKGEQGTKQILKLLERLSEETLVFCLLSGGASALMVAPAAGISLADKQKVTSMLLDAGASINELNAVRKHLSAIKGGRLAQAAAPATMVTVILSDVIGSPLDVIASGPTAADMTTYSDAWAVLQKYSLSSRLPDGVMTLLQRGLAGELPETPKPGDAGLEQVSNFIIGSNEIALQAAARRAEELGWPADILTSSLQGEAKLTAHKLAQRAREELSIMRPGEKRCLLAGGETTVTVNGKGVGGRNQELALEFAQAIEGISGITLLSAGTDGTDGPTDAAGAIVDGETIPSARRAGILPGQYLAENDSWNFFNHLDNALNLHAHFRTGPTGTNVMDMQVILLEGKS